MAEGRLRRGLDRLRVRSGAKAAAYGAVGLLAVVGAVDLVTPDRQTPIAADQDTVDAATSAPSVAATASERTATPTPEPGTPTASASERPAEPPKPLAPSPRPMPEAQPDADLVTTTVTEIVDGDTIWVASGVKVRLIGMDTPETVHPSEPVECFGPEATAHITELIPVGTQVELEYDVELRDQYGSDLAYVYRANDGLHVNLAMVADGFAQVATYPPNVAHVDEFTAAQERARSANSGLWVGCSESSTSTGGEGFAEQPPPPPPAPDPPPTTAAPAEPAPRDGCDPSYPDVCIPPAPPDLDCGEIQFEDFRVTGSDDHGFDGEGDGIGCES